MSNDYRDRWQAAKDASKPPCFGDPDYLDDQDETCRNCAVNEMCSLIAERKFNRGRPANPVKTPPDPVKVQQQSSNVPVPVNNEHRGDVGESFFLALMYNGFLASTEAVLRESVFAVGTIPRVKYPNPFESFNVKPRGTKAQKL